MRKAKNIFENIDYLSVILYLFLIFIGFFNIYASEFNDDSNEIFNLSKRHGRQLLFISISSLIAFFLIIIDWKFFFSLSFLIYAISISSLILILFVGKITNGSLSWFDFGSFRIQPSEFAKFATALAVARYINLFSIKKFNFSKTIICIGLVLVPLLLITFQNDTGTALVFLSFILVLYREGLTENVLIFGFSIFLLTIMCLVLDFYILLILLFCIACITFYFLKKKKKNIINILVLFVFCISYSYTVNYVVKNILPEHQSDRIMVVLGHKKDPYGIGYNVIQSKIAIGSGGIAGKGFLNGTQTRFDFVPEQSTDFIFCTIGEEWGFSGALIFISLYLALLLRILFLSERQRSNFSRVYGYSVACILFVHFLINIGMTIGLFPVVGIPLPFISYGGSSLISFTILLFVFLNLDSYRLQILR
tara:strand:+ start:2211 stop:3473 length:1263 start_codon:yes stop_codon:yes gene_type:complete